MECHASVPLAPATLASAVGILGKAEEGIGAATWKAGQENQSVNAEAKCR